MVNPQTHPIVDKIFDGLALSLHAQAWADAAEGEIRNGSTPRPSPPAAEITSYCGEPAEQAKFAAAQIMGQLQVLNKESIILTLQRASRADGFEIGAYPHTSEEETYAFDFGFSLGLMVTGTGASWYDDHAEFDLDEPLVEFYYESVPVAA
jgi:hypothetical protein